MTAGGSRSASAVRTQLARRAVMSLPPLCRTRGSASSASSLPVIFRSVSSRSSEPVSSRPPTGRTTVCCQPLLWISVIPSSFPRPWAGSAGRICRAESAGQDQLQPVVLEHHRLLERVGRAGLQIREGRGLHPGPVEGDPEHLRAEVLLDDGTVLARSGAAPALAVP